MSSGALSWGDVEGRWATSVYSEQMVLGMGRTVADVALADYPAVARAQVQQLTAVERAGVSGVEIVHAPEDSSHPCAEAHCHIVLPQGVSRSQRKGWGTRLAQLFKVVVSS